MEGLFEGRLEEGGPHLLSYHFISIIPFMFAFLSETLMVFSCLRTLLGISYHFFFSNLFW